MKLSTTIFLILGLIPSVSAIGCGTDRVEEPPGTCSCIQGEDPATAFCDCLGGFYDGTECACFAGQEYRTDPIGGGGYRCRSAVAGTNGDPHFVTWRGERYDYHGECSLELVSDPTFADAKGLVVHIKTKIFDNWSYIKSAAIRIGNDILEVIGGTDGNHYWFNYKYQGELTTMDNFPVTFSYPNKKGKSRSFVIDLGDDDKIEIKTYKEFVRVDFKKPHKELYGNTVGLLGDFATGKKLGRDGVTEIEDYNEFGQEWQLMPGSPQLFHELSGPQAPLEKCILPDKKAVKKRHRHRHRHGRRLGGKEDVVDITEDQAKVACNMAGLMESELKPCIYDVMATEDLDMAGSY